MVNAEQISKLVPTLKDPRLTKIVDLLNKYIDVYKMPDGAFSEFIANVLHESGNFSIKAENLRYTTPERLVAVWPSRFTMNPAREPGKKDARKYINNPQELANLVYGGRMGNVQRGDGFLFRGGGFPQITGRDAYTMFTAFVNRRDLTKRTIAEVAALVQTDDEWAMDAAFWFFCEFKNLEQLAVEDKMKDVVKRWNGGFIGMADRQSKYDDAVKNFG